MNMYIFVSWNFNLVVTANHGDIAVFRSVSTADLYRKMVAVKSTRITRMSVFAVNHRDLPRWPKRSDG